MGELQSYDVITCRIRQCKLIGQFKTNFVQEDLDPPLDLPSISCPSVSGVGRGSEAAARLVSSAHAHTVNHKLRHVNT